VPSRPSTVGTYSFSRGLGGTGRPAGVGTPTWRRKKKKENKSVWGFIENAGDTIKDSIYGTPRVISDTGQDWWESITLQDHSYDRTVKNAKAIAQSYADTYGPLLSGDFDKFGERVYESGGIDVALDVLAVASLGTTALAKIPATAGKVSTVGRTVKLRLPNGKIIERPVSSRALRGNTQRAINAMLNKLPPGTRVIGEGARAGRQADRTSRRTARANEAAAQPVSRAFAKLNKSDRVATVLLGKLPHPKDLNAYVTQLGAKTDDVSRAALAVIQDPKVQKAYLNPTPKIRKALDESRVLVGENERILGSLLSDTARTTRPYLDSLLARGAKFRQGELIPAEGFASIEDMIGSIRDDLQKSGRPEPVYFPDTSELKNADAKITYGRGGGSVSGGQNLIRAAQRQNQGKLAAAGQRILDPQVLVDKYVGNTKWAHYADIHKVLMASAVAIDNLSQMPDGWELVRQPAREFTALIDDSLQKVGKTPQRVGYTEKAGRDFQNWIRENMQGDPFTTKIDTDAMKNAEGKFLIVPKEFARQVKGEFTKSSNFVYLMNKYPVRVWRAAVLNLRPAWLVNNMVGNTVMYTIANLDRQGLTALFTNLKLMYPKDAAKFDEIMRKKFAQQQSGTFIGTQRPTGLTSSRGKAIRAAGKVVGSLAEADRRWEAALRSKAVRAEIKRNPAIRKAAKQMRDETSDFWEAAAKTLDERPELVQQIEMRVNDALGDFNSLTSFEKNYVRSVFPFYAWYRAITGVVIKLPLDQPVKVALLSRLGEIGVDANLEALGMTREEAPDFLRGFIPIGEAQGDRGPGISTASMNPFATVVDLERFTATLALAMAGQAKPGQLKESLPGVNPLFGSVGEGVFGGGYGGKQAPPLWSVYADLPQTKLAEAFGLNIDPFSEPYQGTRSKPRLFDQDPRDQLLRYLGAGYARVSKRRAEQIKEGD
jgi:hypothetical protein